MRVLKRLVILGILIAVLIGSFASAATPIVGAQSGGGYELTWNTIDSGGVMFSAGGDFSLSGTIGQPDASAALGGGGYALVGGFWSGIPPYSLYLPLILKS